MPFSVKIAKTPRSQPLTPQFAELILHDCELRLTQINSLRMSSLCFVPGQRRAGKLHRARFSFGTHRSGRSVNENTLLPCISTKNRQIPSSCERQDTPRTFRWYSRAAKAALREGLLADPSLEVYGRITAVLSVVLVRELGPNTTIIAVGQMFLSSRLF